MIQRIEKIQPGDLLFWTTRDEAGNLISHHSTIITGVTESGISYSRNTNTRSDQDLSEVFKADSDDDAIVIVRIKDQIPG